jgi:hypothetical protein
MSEMLSALWAKNGRKLCFRWLHPISLALYEVIFRRDPVRYFEESLARRVEARPTKEWAASAKRMIGEIRLELEDPTQPVRDIIGCRASEEDLREYLRLVADDLERRLHSSESGMAT